jgi:hypothetical protein
MSVFKGASSVCFAAALALITGAANLHAYKPALEPLSLEEKVNAAEYIVVARIVRFRYFRFDSPPAGQPERGAYLGEEVPELKAGMRKYEDIEVLQVLYPPQWVPANPIPGNLGISWYPDPVRGYHASTPQVRFLRATRAGVVAEGYLEPVDSVFRGVSIRGLAATPEPLEKLPDVEVLVKRRIQREAFTAPRGR